MSDYPDEVERDLADVRARVSDGELFSPGVTAQIDALRASVHEQLRSRGIDPTSLECEHAMVVAGGIVGQSLASPDTTAMLANQRDDEQRGGVAALLMWSASISPRPGSIC